MTRSTQDIRERARKNFEEILRALGVWSDCNGRKCGKCWADTRFIDNIITKAQEKEQWRAYNILDKYAMNTQSKEALDLLEAAQREIIDDDLTKRT